MTESDELHSLKKESHIISVEPSVLDSTPELVVTSVANRQATITALKKRLKTFAESHFDFFHKGFEHQSPARLAESKIFGIQAVLGRINFKVGEDAEILLRAEAQGNDRTRAEALLEADRLVTRALNAAKRVLRDPCHPDEKGVSYTGLTYFQKYGEIRVIPYAPVALVGLPLNAIREKNNLLAIPHEVGHYVYHHRNIDPSTDPISHQYVPASLKYSDWQEEVFADVCGSLIAGPVMAFDFQELVKRYDREYFLVAGGHGHPPPFVRPLIYTHALRARTNPRWQTLANELDQRWKRYLYAEWNKLFGLPNGTTMATLRTRIMGADAAVMGLNKEDAFYLKQLQQAMPYIQVVKDEIGLGDDVQVLVDAALMRLNGIEDDWTPNLTPANLATDEAALRWWNSLTFTGIGLDPPVLGEKSDIWKHWVTAEKFFGDIPPDPVINPASKETILITAGDDIYEFSRQPAVPKKGPDGYPIYVWQPLWYASGWTTQGPMEGPGRPP